MQAAGTTLALMLARRSIIDGGTSTRRGKYRQDLLVWWVDFAGEHGGSSLYEASLSSIPASISSRVFSSIIYIYPSLRLFQVSV